MSVIRERLHAHPVHIQIYYDRYRYRYRYRFIYLIPKLAIRENIDIDDNL